MTKVTINPPELFDSAPAGFSQVVISTPGKLIFISGQVAWDKNKNISDKNDLAGQTRKALENLKIAVKSAGGGLEKITMLRIYKVNLQKEDTAVITSLLTEYFGTSNQPASTWISVQGLANKDFMIEIEAQAVV